MIKVIFGRVGLIDLRKVRRVSLPNGQVAEFRRSKQPRRRPDYRMRGSLLLTPLCAAIGCVKGRGELGWISGWILGAFLYPGGWILRGFVGGSCVDFCTLFGWICAPCFVTIKCEEKQCKKFYRYSPDIHPMLHPGIHPAEKNVHPVFTRYSSGGGEAEN